LTWLQEHTSPVFVVATCNDYRKLPPELTRAGRFDEIFFVDLPTQTERQAIAEIHLSRLSCETNLAGHIAEISDGWSGAEIEKAIKSAVRRTNRQPTAEVFDTIASRIVPLSQSRREEMDTLREVGRGMYPANAPEAPKGVHPPRRKIKR
jgi:SpoVK/Ycf46/Vps4 family AAA+-type ATPase